MAGLSQAYRSVFRWVIARLDEGFEVLFRCCARVVIQGD